MIVPFLLTSTVKRAFLEYTTSVSSAFKHELALNLIQYTSILYTSTTGKISGGSKISFQKITRKLEWINNYYIYVTTRCGLNDLIVTMLYLYVTVKLIKRIFHDSLPTNFNRDIKESPMNIKIYKIPNLQISLGTTILSNIVISIKRIRIDIWLNMLTSNELQGYLVFYMEYHHHGVLFLCSLCWNFDNLMYTVRTH